MNRKQFNATAKANGLTVKQLIKLSMIQSEVYHAIKFDGAVNSPDTTFMLGDIAHDGRKMTPIRALEDAGLITINGGWGAVVVTTKGWAIECNAGAGVFIGGCNDTDITDEENDISPVTFFNCELETQNV